MIELRGHRPRLVVRESPLFQLLAMLMLLGLLGGFFWLTLAQDFPLFIILASGGALTLLLLIQARILLATLRPENWLIRFYSHGIALQTGGHLSNEDHRTLFIPAEALRGARIVREQWRRRPWTRPQEKHKLNDLTGLEIVVDKSRVKELADTHRPSHIHRPRPIKLRFLFNPITENAEGYRIELRSHRSRVTPRIGRIAEAFRIYGITTQRLHLTANLEALQDHEFEERLVRAMHQGHTQLAIDMLMDRDRLTSERARQRLDQIMSRQEARQGATGPAT